MNTGNNTNNEDNFYSISEVSNLTGVKPNILRDWENHFKQINPMKNKHGHRIYTDQDIKIILTIKKMIYDNNLSIDYVKNYFEQKNLKQNNNYKIIKKKLLEILDFLKNSPK